MDALIAIAGFTVASIIIVFLEREGMWNEES